MVDYKYQGNIKQKRAGNSLVYDKFGLL